MAAERARENAPPAALLESFRTSDRDLLRHLTRHACGHDEARADLFTVARNPRAAVASLGDRR